MSSSMILLAGVISTRVNHGNLCTSRIFTDRMKKTWNILLEDPSGYLSLEISFERSDVPMRFLFVESSVLVLATFIVALSYLEVQCL